MTGTKRGVQWNLQLAHFSMVAEALFQISVEGFHLLEAWIVARESLSRVWIEPRV